MNLKLTISSLLFVLLLASGCATKTLCANGLESYRPVLDSSSSCKVRIRQVVIGSDIKIPESLSMAKGNAFWSYEWRESEFKDGEIVLGHIVLKVEGPESENDRK